MSFKQFLEVYSKGLVPEGNKVHIAFDQHDKDLYLKAQNEFNNSIAAKVILARYGYLRTDLQQKAIESGVYFKNINDKIAGSPGTLVIKNQEIPINSYIGELRQRISEYIPLLSRWGGSNPSSRTGINFDRLSKGIQVNYHAREEFKSETWKHSIKSDGSKFISEKEFKDAFENPDYPMDFTIILGKINTTHHKLLQLIFDNIQKKNIPFIEMQNILSRIYIKLGNISKHNNSQGMLVRTIQAEISNVLYHAKSAF